MDFASKLSQSPNLPPSKNEPNKSINSSRNHHHHSTHQDNEMSITWLDPPLSNQQLNEYRHRGKKVPDAIVGMTNLTGNIMLRNSINSIKRHMRQYSFFCNSCLACILRMFFQL